MAIQVEVTQEDIDHGLASDCLMCPVARAICRVKGVIGALVGGDEIGLRWAGVHPPRYVPTPTPKPAREFIRDFDAFGPSGVRPFSFSLDIETVGEGE